MSRLKQSGIMLSKGCCKDSIIQNPDDMAHLCKFCVSTPFCNHRRFHRHLDVYHIVYKVEHQACSSVRCMWDDYTVPSLSHMGCRADDTPSRGCYTEMTWYRGFRTSNIELFVFYDLCMIFE